MTDESTLVSCGCVLILGVERCAVKSWPRPMTLRRAFCCWQRDTIVSGCIEGDGFSPAVLSNSALAKSLCLCTFPAAPSSVVTAAAATGRDSESTSTASASPDGNGAAIVITCPHPASEASSEDASSGNDPQLPLVSDTECVTCCGVVSWLGGVGC